MLRKVVLDSDVGEGEGPATSTRRKRQSKQKTRLHKRKNIGARSGGESDRYMSILNG